MKKEQILSILVIIGLIFVLSHLFYSFAEERVSLISYYPAPYGYYRELRADTAAVGSGYRTAGLSDGVLIVNGSVGVGKTWPLARFDIADDGAVSTGYLDFGSVAGILRSVYFGNATSHDGGISFNTTGRELNLFSENNGDLYISPWGGGRVIIPSQTVIGLPPPGTDEFDATVMFVNGANQLWDNVGTVRVASANPSPALVLGWNSNPNYAGWIQNANTSGRLFINPGGGNTVVGSTAGNIRGASIGSNAWYNSNNGALFINGDLQFTDSGRGFVMCNDGSSCPANYYTLACGTGQCTGSGNIALSSNCYLASPIRICARLSN